MYQLSSHELDLSVLKHGLHQSFTDKNNIKQNLAVKLEELSSKLDFAISNDSKKNFNEYFRSVTNIMSNNIYQDKDNTLKPLNKLRKTENIVISLAEKESCTVILNRTDYVNKTNAMIDEGISKGKYVKL